MRNLHTAAMRISRATYNLAVAVLPPEFALHPFDYVEGAYVVINELSVEMDGDGNRILAIGNIWMMEDRFLRKYRIADADQYYSLVRFVPTELKVDA